MRRPGEHLKHHGSDHCNFCKFTELARDSRPSGGQNRVTGTGRPGEHLKHLSMDQCPGNTSNTSGGTNIRD
ncbi:hypothetical protein CsSME_00001880 [Camellia sinensis var. sinensis]